MRNFILVCLVLVALLTPVAIALATVPTNAPVATASTADDLPPCCFEGSPCCGLGLPCCEGGDCCFEGSPCCFEGSPCCAPSCCAHGASCCK
jgi:hypothetical protein